MLDDKDALAARVQALLSEEGSRHRASLNALVLDALLAMPTSVVLGDPELTKLIVAGLTESTAAPIANDAVRPAFDRVQATLTRSEDRLRDLIPESAVPILAELLARGRGPRFGWLGGAVDPALMRQLVAPIVQDVLLSFAQNLPIPGVSGGGGGGSGGKSSGGRGFMGGFAKQMSRSAGQLADLGKGVMGGLGAELERRMQAVARDFSQTAMTQVRTSLLARIRSPEGRALTEKMRAQALEHVLDTPASTVVDDLMHLPVDDIVALVPSILDHNHVHPTVPGIIEGEVEALLSLWGGKSVGEWLDESGLLEQTRALALRAVDAPTAALFASEAFGGWLSDLLDEA